MEQEELDLLQYWQVIKKRWIIIVAIPLIASLISGLVSFYLIKPVYQASTTLIVGKKAADNAQQANQLLDYNVLLANQQLAKTYGAIAKSRTVEENVINELELPLTLEQLDPKVSVDPVKNTEILQISVTDNDPNLAAEIANTMADKFSDAVIHIKKVDSVSIVDPAATPVRPIKPKLTLNVLIAFAVGLMAAAGIAFLLEYLDNTIRSTKDVEAILGLPVLGVIPYYTNDKKHRKEDHFAELYASNLAESKISNF